MAPSEFDPARLSDLIEPIRHLAREAGNLIEGYYNPNGLDGVLEKTDGSPVTIADREAEAFITPALQKLTPDVPVIAEEAAEAGKLPTLTHGNFWLVDPLDGTKGFTKGSGEFTVNIALMVDYRPILGVIVAPVLGEEYVGYGLDSALFRGDDGRDQAMRVATPTDALRVTASRSHRNQDALDAFLAGRNVATCEARSSSLKFCEVAAGKADIYPRFGPTCEWDTAAGQAILEAAGGVVTALDGGHFAYGKADRKFLNDGFIAWGGVDPASWFAGNGPETSLETSAKADTGIGE
ncbi:MAG: 3'(2'),5'-bisphosphate nucleotidase CysQ [Pseudomonadota bacterium]